MITKEEFVEWKRDKVTKQVFAQIADKIEDLKERLANEVAHELEGSQATAGAILAFKDVLDIDYEESE